MRLRRSILEKKHSTTSRIASVFDVFWEFYHVFYYIRGKSNLPQVLLFVRVIFAKKFYLKDAPLFYRAEILAKDWFCLTGEIVIRLLRGGMLDKKRFCLTGERMFSFIGKIFYKE